MTDEEKTLAIAAGALITIAGVKHIRTVRRERAKRKRILEWMHTNLTCIAQYEERLKTAAQTPGMTVTEFNRIKEQEDQFLDIVRNSIREK